MEGARPTVDPDSKWTTLSVVATGELALTLSRLVHSPLKLIYRLFWSTFLATTCAALITLIAIRWLSPNLIGLDSRW